MRISNDELLDKIKDEQGIIIFGYGLIGRYIYQVLQSSLSHKPICFCDNGKIRQGKQGKIIVLSVQEAVREKREYLFLTASMNNSDIMKKQLVELGLNEERIISCVTQEALYMWEHRKTELDSYKVRDKIQFEINLVEHCNLKCKCCSQFSCIADEEYIDIEQMEKDLCRMTELFSGICEHIYLIGGEPLLHPNIIKCMELSRKYFPTGKVGIFTNGLLLLRQNDAFWEACRKNRISIIVTSYPIHIEHEKIIKKCNEEKIKFLYSDDFGGIKTMINIGLDLKGKQDIEYSFSHCHEANKCIKLNKGKLFTCSVAPAIYKFNKFFNQNLEVTEDDYINIYEVATGEEVLKRLSMSIPFCRYCNKVVRPEEYSWGRTTGNIEEWVVER